MASGSSSFLLVISSYLPVIGGSEIEAQRVCVAMRERGWASTVVCPGGEPMPRMSRWTDPEGIPVRIFGHGSGRLRDLAFSVGVVFTLLYGASRYRFVYFLMPGLQLAFGLPVARLLGKPMVMKFSGANEIRKLTKSTLGRLELRWLNRWAKRILVLNPGMLEEAAEAGLSPAKLLWMPNPVDVTVFAPVANAERRKLRERLGLPVDVTIVMFVGRLAPEKQIPTLVRAFAKVAARQSDSRLVLVGDGPLRSELERLAGELGIARQVIFAGKTDPGEVHLYLKSADAFALVSSLEGFPVSLVEAMACGLPAVVSDIPANAQLVTHEVNGLISRTGDVPSTAAALERLVSDGALRERLGTAGRQLVVERYATNRIADMYDNLFAELASA